MGLADTSSSERHSRSEDNADAASPPLILSALRGVRSSHVPVWFMRQAGRSLPEYRKIREGVSMLDSCLDAEIASEITVQPVRRHKVDAAIFFSDIVIPLKLAGVDVAILPGVGPVLEKPVQSEAAFLELPDPANVDFSLIEKAVFASIAKLEGTPLLGFGGAPFTLASYLIEGKPSKSIPTCRTMMVDNFELWSKILIWCAELTARFLQAQIQSGVIAVQLFDSWAGRLSAEEYRRFAKPFSAHTFSTLKHAFPNNDVPMIHFGVGTRSILKDMVEVGASVIGIDSETDIAEASAILDNRVPVQGNLNPKLLLGEWSGIEKASAKILRAATVAPSHIFNLGHGVLPETNPDVITRLVEYIHSVDLTKA